jgi:DNA-directed RNA polymerase specialized sigma24 family protein
VPFETTHWSLVRAAGGPDTTAAHAALSKLCELYWYPLYAFVRRWGANPDDARDLTQGFLTSLLDRQDFENLRQERGRFRAFLLASLKHFLTNDALHRSTLKRGGGAVILSLSMDDAEGLYRIEPAEPTNPESLYERRWALTIIERVMAHLRQEWEAADRAAEFDELKACLLGETPDGGYAAVAEKLNMTEGAVRTAIHRLKRRFQTRLRQDIAETVDDPADVEDELKYLVRALNPSK